MKSRLFSIIGIAGLAVLASTGAITVQETGKGQASEDSVDSGIEIIELIGVDIPLKHRNVRCVYTSQCVSLGKILEQPGIVGRRVLNHRRIRFQQRVNGCNGSLLCLRHQKKTRQAGS
jgi:hypothetical protein